MTERLPTALRRSTAVQPVSPRTSTAGGKNRLRHEAFPFLGRPRPAVERELARIAPSAGRTTAKCVSALPSPS